VIGRLRAGGRLADTVTCCPASSVSLQYQTTVSREWSGISC
jgi:hypothetical protein